MSKFNLKSLVCALEKRLTSLIFFNCLFISVFFILHLLQPSNSNSSEGQMFHLILFPDKSLCKITFLLKHQYNSLKTIRSFKGKLQRNNQQCVWIQFLYWIFFFQLQYHSSLRQFQICFPPCGSSWFASIQYHKPQCNLSRVYAFVIFKGDVSGDVFSEPKHTNTHHKEKKMI